MKPSMTNISLQESFAHQRIEECRDFKIPVTGWSTPYRATRQRSRLRMAFRAVIFIVLLVSAGAFTS